MQSQPRRSHSEDDTEKAEKVKCFARRPGHLKVVACTCGAATQAGVQRAQRLCTRSGLAKAAIMTIMKLK